MSQHNEPAQPFIKHFFLLSPCCTVLCLGHVISVTSGILVHADFDPADRAVCFKLCLL